MKYIFFLLIAFLLWGNTSATISLPNIFTDNMVIQRDKPLKIWGWADKGETVTISFNGQKSKTKAGADGSWNISIAAMSFGGPFEMNISGKNTILFKNILIGDVFVCSGQSNMEWPLKITNEAKKEIAESNHPAIRLFTVEKEMAYQPLKNVKGKWLECDPENSADFSAVAYFFGRKLNKDLNIPIGLINTSWGGTNIETWISWDKMGKKDPYLHADIAQMERDRAGMKEKQRQFVESLKNDKGMAEKWYDPSVSSVGWRKIQVPKLWEQTEIGNADGIIWFRKEFELPDSWEGKPVQLSLGPIDDNDITFVNGQQVGAINLWNDARNYTINSTILKKGKNTITIKVEDTGGGGGIYGEAGQLFVEGNDQRISLAGEWEYKVSVTNIGWGIKDTGPNAFPSQLYNAMIAPIINYGIKGAIWYQGESNAAEGYYYRTLFAEMINDWRTKWGYEFPFFWVQLANYMKGAESPDQSNWAELREAQSLTLSLPATGQAVIIDIGEANDIHPRNKQDVGYRLALAAEKIAYGKDIIYSGPVYQSMTMNGNKVILNFSNKGTGLLAKDRYGYLKGFSIAGHDQKFVWAKAMIEGDKVIVFSEAIDNPVAVRYAWADNPSDANFYNKEGLPASPFRTDDWKLKSQK